MDVMDLEKRYALNKYTFYLFQLIKPHQFLTYIYMNSETIYSCLIEWVQKKDMRISLNILLEIAMLGYK